MIIKIKFVNTAQLFFPYIKLYLNLIVGLLSKTVIILKSHLFLASLYIFTLEPIDECFSQSAKWSFKWMMIADDHYTA